LQHYIRDKLLNSVRDHLVADVPLGLFLSGGVDSGALLGLMREVTQQNIQTVTLAFKEFRGSHNDESPLAKQIADQYGAHHTTYVVTEQDFQRDLPQIFEAMDQPSIDGVNTWFISKAIRELGLKAAVSGLGGDELFGGYPSFQDIPRWVRLFSLPSYIPFLGDAFKNIATRTNRTFPSLNPKTTGILKYGGTYAGAYLLRRGLFMPWELELVMDKDMAKEGLERLCPLRHIADVIDSGPKSAWRKVAVLEASLYMRNQLLRDTDWASMKHSVEIRLPLVDAQLLRELVPIAQYGPKSDSKAWLGQSPSLPLPAATLERKKTGFTIPIQKWTRHLKGTHSLEGKSRPSNWNFSRRWSCVVLDSFLSMN